MWQEMMQAEADGAEISDGGREVLSCASNESGFVEQDVVKEEPRLGISLAEGLKCFQTFTEIECDRRRREDRINGEGGDEIFRRDTVCTIFLESSGEFLKVFPWEGTACSLRMTAKACEQVSRSGKQIGDVYCRDTPERSCAVSADDTCDHTWPSKLFCDLSGQESNDAR